MSRPATLLLLALAGCGKGGDTAAAPTCQPALATDIDETLTTSDGEWLSQLADPTYDPAERPDAATTFQAYADKGYAVAYITARGSGLELADGRSGTEATEDWLVDHCFPSGRVFLADHAIGVTGDDAVAYKVGAIASMQDEGWRFDYAYGNADTDIEAFQQAGIGDDIIFLVGELAGTMGVQPIPDADAYTAHLAAHLPNVPEAACP